MQRYLLLTLQDWKKRLHRTPVLIRGARQVGKTWVAREFGKSFDSFVELNLEERTDLHPFFQKHFGNPQALIKNLEAALQTKITPGKSLLFLDEIQECDEAIQSLRYFKEKFPELHVLATGSLLEFRLKKLGFPVGRVEFHWLFPLSFEEFLWAHQVPTQYDPDLDVDRIFESHFSAYLNIGGMPEVAAAWVQSKDFNECQRVLQRLASAYRIDFHKYAKERQIEPIRLVFEQTARHWGHKLKYASISQEYRAAALRGVIELLQDAGLVTPCVQTAGNGVPLSAEAKAEHFKLYSVDLGLGQRLLNLNIKETSWRDCLNRGGLMEQFIAQELRSMTPPNMEPELFFWQREAQGAKAELDFLTAVGPRVLPIEVKSGTSGHHKSLDQFIKEKKPEKALVVSTASEFNLKSSIASAPAWRFFQAMRELSD